MVDTNCTYHFMCTFKKIFVSVRSNPEDKYNVPLLNLFQKYTALIPQMNKIEIAKLKNDINSMEELEDGLKADLISTLDIYTCKENMKNREKVNTYMPVLNEFVNEIVNLLHSKESTRVRDLADAAHNFPEFLINELWSPKDYWKIYITPYRKQWDKNFLNNWENRFLEKIKPQQKSDTEMFYLKFGDQIKLVRKIKESEFTSYHHEVLAGIKLQDGNIVIASPDWYSVHLGAGEEKAVFCICDNENRVFALEVIDEKHYLNGRFVGGQYFFDKRIEALQNKKLKPDSWIGLTFTGLVKVREFVYGYEWGRFQLNPNKQVWVDHILTSWVQFFLSSRFNEFKKRYKDVHERNVMLEIRDSKPGIPVITKDWTGRVRLVRAWIQPIDVR